MSIIFACGSTILAQQSQAPKVAESDHKVLVIESNVQRVTGDLLKDASSLAPLQRAILFSQLGDLLWKADAERGRQMLKRAVEELENAMAQESAVAGDRQPDKEQLVDAARVVLLAVSARDRQLTERLLERLAVLTEGPQKGRDMSPSNNIAEALVASALLAVEKDAGRGARLGSLSLRYGESMSFHRLLIRLRERDGRLADDLFAEALGVAQAAHSVNLLSALTLAAFPATYDPSFKGEAPADKLRAGLLRAIAAGVMREDRAGESTYCDHANVMARLLTEVDRLLPRQAGYIRAALTKCEARSLRVEEALSAAPLRTVDDYLTAAEKAPTLERRLFTLFRAAKLAEQQQDFQKALSILDNLTKEERQALGDTWESMRVDMTLEAALFYYTKQDFTSMEKVIDSAPTGIKPFINLDLAKRLVESKMRDEAFIRERLASARQALAKFEKPEFWLYTHYMTMARLYGSVDPPEAPVVVREMAKTMNRAAKAVQSGDRGAEERAAAGPLFELPVLLLDTYVDELIETVSTIESPLLRARARLSVLASLLEQRQQRIDKVAEKK